MPSARLVLERWLGLLQCKQALIRYVTLFDYFPDSRALICRYVTMPLDTIKTRSVNLIVSYGNGFFEFNTHTFRHRMQSLDAKKEYGNMFNCAMRIFREEGVFTFWSGALPRLARLMVSGGIVFTM